MKSDNDSGYARDGHSVCTRPSGVVLKLARNQSIGGELELSTGRLAVIADQLNIWQSQNQSDQRKDRSRRKPAEIDIHERCPMSPRAAHNLVPDAWASLRIFFACSATKSGS
jgi:hypothetical protein